MLACAAMDFETRCNHFVVQKRCRPLSFAPCSLRDMYISAGSRTGAHFPVPDTMQRTSLDRLKKRYYLVAVRHVSFNGVHARHARICMLNAPDGNDNPKSAGDDDEAADDDSTMRVHRRNAKNKPYNGDLLPFDVTVISPPPAVLGRFRLDPRTHCGDIIEHNGRQFVVKRVRLHYRYDFNGKVIVYKKTIEIKSLARKSIESYLEKVLRDS